MYYKKSKTIQSKVEQSLRDLLLKPMFISINGWMEKKNIKQTWTPVSTHERTWTPMITNEFKCIPLIFHWFSKTLQFAIYIFRLCFFNGWFIILGVWSCVVLSQSILFTKLENHNSFFFILAGLEPRKTLHCHCCSTCLYIYI